MSAPLAASTLFVPTFTFNFAVRALAPSACATVARVDFADSKPFFSNACRIMPPILPAPRNATFFPARSLAIIFLDPHFLVRIFCGSHLSQSAQCHPMPLHKIPGSRHHVPQAARRLPLEEGLRFRGIRYQ